MSPPNTTDSDTTLESMSDDDDQFDENGVDAAIALNHEVATAPPPPSVKVMLKQVDALAAYLKKHLPRNVMMPVIDKHPCRRHKGGVWTWEQFSMFREDYPQHSEFSILLQDLCVVDIDKHELIDTWVQDFPELGIAPMELTKHGAHMFFLQSPLAKAELSARQIKGIDNDFKSVSTTGTGGVIVVAPAGVRRWVRMLCASQPIAMISDELLRSIAMCKGDSVTEVNVGPGLANSSLAGTPCGFPQDGFGDRFGALDTTLSPLQIIHAARGDPVRCSEDLWLEFEQSLSVSESSLGLL